MPSVGLTIVNVATPLTSAMPAWTVTPLSIRSTVPVGTVTVPVTVIVAVTDWPDADGFGEVTTATLGVALFTVNGCGEALLLLMLKLPSPLYAALIAYGPPATIVLSVSVAVPPLSVAVPMVPSVASVNVTVPLGVPAPGAG